MAALNTFPTDAKARKAVPVATGCVDYFPRALAAVAELSRIGNEQHNPGKPLHWDRSKSTDEADCLMRHFMDRGRVDNDGVRHSAKVAWRALALLEKELEGVASAVQTMRDGADFYLGETVNLRHWDFGKIPGKIVAFSGDLVQVDWAPAGGMTFQRRSELRHGP